MLNIQKLLLGLLALGALSITLGYQNIIAYSGDPEISSKFLCEQYLAGHLENTAIFLNTASAQEIATKCQTKVDRNFKADRVEKASFIELVGAENDVCRGVLDGHVAFKDLTDQTKSDLNAYCNSDLDDQISANGGGCGCDPNCCIESVDLLTGKKRCDCDPWCGVGEPVDFGPSTGYFQDIMAN